jgi:dolichol-phosphate mannosyltransferase
MSVTLSVVVPVKDEAGNAAALARDIAANMVGRPHEIIFVDDGSSDGTVAELLSLKSEMRQLRVVQHNRNFGQSRAIRTGVRAAVGPIIVTLDGDGQNDPADIGKLLTVLESASESDHVGMVSGIRMNRQDPSNRKLAAEVASRFRRSMLKDGAVDTGCGLKAFRRDAYLALPYFDHMHRFLIALMLREGYDVRYVEVRHRPRQHGHSKYNNLHRAFVGLIDTFGVRWLQRRFGDAVEPKEL